MEQSKLYQRKESCCGCGACKNVCPKKAITMSKDEEGFLYPVIKEKNCINCKLCISVCPMNKQINQNNVMPLSVIARTNNMEQLQKSASGGFVASLAEWFVLREQGTVFAAFFDHENNVVHKLVRTIKELEGIGSSKYVQSDIGETYSLCKNELENKHDVLFIGTPCQIAGLRCFLKKEYTNLLTIDFVCHGVPSPDYWDAYKRYLEKKYNSCIKSINFRDKGLGYRSTRMKIMFDNGKIYTASPRTDYMLKAFFTHIINRPSCANCHFKSYTHNSDFTCFDCFLAEKVNNQCIDDNQGYTSVLVNSVKAEVILKKTKDIMTYNQVSLKTISPSNGGMILNSAKPHLRRSEFWNEFNNSEFEEVSKKFLNIRFFDILVESTKKYLYKMGILSLLSRIHINMNRRPNSVHKDVS